MLQPTLRSPHVPRLIVLSPWCSLEEFKRLAVDAEEDGELVISDDMPHIDVMRAGIRLGYTFRVEERRGSVRLIAR